MLKRQIVGDIRGKDEKRSFYYFYPRFEILGNGMLKEIMPAEFPNRGTIFLHVDSSDNDMNIANNQIVIIDAMIKSMSNYEIYNPNSCKYSIDNKTSEIMPLEDHQAIEILEIKNRTFEDIIKHEALRYVKIGALPLNKSVMVNVGEYVYGIFLIHGISDSKDVVSHEFKLNETIEQRKSGNYVIYQYRLADLKPYIYAYTRFVSIEQIEERNFIFDIKSINVKPVASLMFNMEKENDGASLIQTEEIALESLQNKIATKQEEIIKLDNAIDDRKELLSSIIEESNVHNRELDKARTQIDELDTIYRQRIIDVEKINTQIKEKICEFDSIYNEFEKKMLTKAMNNREEDLTKKIFEFGNITSRENSSKARRLNYDDLCKATDWEIKIEDLLSRFNIVFENAGRKLKSEDILNYLICITQRFVTVFAGAPGVGKTSLAALISKTLGLYEHRFAQVSVERNWTSYKDWVGYYNPLTGQVEKAPTGVFDTFSNLDYECNQNIKIPQIILLDEANLSQIEHYWSKFLLSCDPTDSNKNVFEVSEFCSFKLSESLRFIATINFDHTTEMLSERFLDRAWVILIENPSLLFNEYSEKHVENFDRMVSYDAIKSLFSPKTGEKLATKVLDVFQEIIEVFSNSKKHISPRSQKAVEAYCLVAQRYIGYYKNCELKPLDYALAQKVLPLINGYGEGYKMMLEALNRKFDTYNMDICKKIVSDILLSGEAQHGYYQFFGRV